MEDRIIHNFGTGEILQEPYYEASNLIYHDGASNSDFEFGVTDITFPDWKNESLEIELHAIQSIENIMNHYLNYLNSPDHTKRYSHFYVLHDNICDVYIPGFKFLSRYSDDADLDYLENFGNQYNFWLIRLKYHRSMLIEVINKFKVTEPGRVHEVIEVEHEDCWNYIAIDKLTTVGNINGGDILGIDNFECHNSSICSTCSLRNIL